MTRTVQIIGAGISGLLCAYHAVEKGYAVEVYDTAAEPGGKIQTRQGKHGLMESAANAILADALVESVADTIGLKLIAKQTTAKKRYIYTLGAVRRWPLGFIDSLRLLRFLFLWKLNSPSIQPRHQETLKTWSDRVLSAEVTERLLGPACQGIFGVDAQPLSARLIFNYFFAKVPRAHGKLRGSVAPEGGMGQWVEFLVRYLRSKNVQFYFSQTAPADSGKVVIVATDLQNAVQILKQKNDVRGEILSSVPLVDLLSVNVFYQQRPSAQAPGFGVLFARSENLRPLGVLINSDIFANRSSHAHSETWIFGALSSDNTELTDEFYLSHVQAARQKLWKTNEQPQEFKINRWPSAIPLYGLDLEKALTKLAQESPEAGLYLMGNYLGELGLNRLFHQAKSLLDTIGSV
jgi:protoporphyrinogen/coproporphyrinogen III oxidase